MDEIFGYFPPHPANPPTKRPLLTLLKQARAQGVGVVLATQNPVDLDYKGLANMGTWMVGHAPDRPGPRAAARRARWARASTPPRSTALLDATRKRVFLLHDVHRSGPVPASLALGDVVPARAADARGDRAPDGRARRPRRRAGAAASRRVAGPPVLPAALRPQLPREVRRRSWPIPTCS